MSDFQTTTTHTARKQRICCGCGCLIPKGVRYTKIAQVWLGEFHVSHWHPDCRQLWEQLYHDHADDTDGMVHDMLDALESLSTAELQEELNSWRGRFPHAVNRLEYRARKRLNDLEDD